MRLKEDYCMTKRFLAGAIRYISTFIITYKLITNITSYFRASPRQYSAKNRIIVYSTEMKIHVDPVGNSIETQRLIFICLIPCVQSGKYLGSRKPFPVVVHAIKNILQNLWVFLGN